MAKEKKKICPLTYTVGKGAYDQEISNFDYCVKEKCAWWIKTMGGLSIDNCSIKAFAVSQLHISGCLKIKK